MFNIGADNVYSVNELASVIMDTIGKKSDINYLEARNEVVHAYSDHSKIKDFFKINKYTSLNEGVMKMAEWVKQHGARQTPLFKDIEITEKLPSVWTVVEDASKVE